MPTCVDFFSLIRMDFCWQLPIGKLFFLQFGFLATIIDCPDVSNLILKSLEKFI